MNADDDAIRGSRATVRENFEKLVHSVFAGNAWHGASLFGTLRKLTLEQALWENREGYSPWKIALHCAYWKHRARIRIVPTGRDGKKERFPRSPAEFPDLPEPPDLTAWKTDLALLQSTHERLLEAVRAVPWYSLTTEEQSRYFREITGVAAHDAYHTGMIRNMGVPGL